MASPERSLPANMDGNFFVDDTCIDCATCRWMAPETYRAEAGHSVVGRQPRTEAERLRALQALVSCPTASIGTRARLARGEMRGVVASLPALVHGDEHGEVLHCGFHDESSFGAASYLIRRPEGNVLVDAPRFTRPLVRRLEELGGVRTMFLTHRDDVGDHARFREHFECERILHSADVTESTRDVERKLAGTAPVRLDADTLLLPVPGHTRGSCVLVWRETYLFSGDHVAWSEELGHVYAFRRACWFDWGTQIESMRRLAEFEFEWILPGHGRRCHFERGRMRSELERTLAWMESA